MHAKTMHDTRNDTMLRLIPTLCLFGLAGSLLVGCAGDYTVYEEVSASERPVVAAGTDGSAPVVVAPAVVPPVADGYPAVSADASAVAMDATAGAAPAAPAETGLADGAMPAMPLGLDGLPGAIGLGDSSDVGGPPAQPQAGTVPDPLLTRLANAGGPVRLEILSIGVDAPIEHVGLTGDGEAMEAPRGWMNVAWYHKGYQPGEPGNAVVAGHLDTNAGGPAVFWQLNQVSIGDEVAVTYANGDRYSFVVEDWKVYDHDAQGPIIDSIFGKSQTADLNLVTCDGAWDHGAATYSKRLVVFATLEPEKTVLAGGGEVMQ